MVLENTQSENRLKFLQGLELTLNQFSQIPSKSIITTLAFSTLKPQINQSAIKSIIFPGFSVKVIKWEILRISSLSVTQNQFAFKKAKTQNWNKNWSRVITSWHFMIIWQTIIKIIYV